MLKKYTHILRGNVESIIFAALCSLYPIAKVAILYKELPATQVEQVILLYALIYFIVPISSIGYLDWFFKNIAKNDCVESLYKPLFISLITAVVFSISLFIYTYYKFNNEILSFLISAELLSIFIFTYSIRYIRSVSGGKNFFKYSLVRHIIEIVIIIILISLFSLRIELITLGASVANIATAVIVFHVISKVVSQKKQENISVIVKEIARHRFSILLLFFGILCSSFFSQMDKIIIQPLLSQDDYILYGYYSFSRNIMLSFSAFMFTTDFLRVSKELETGYIREYIISRTKVIAAIYPLLFIVHAFLIIYFLGYSNLNYNYLLISFASNSLFLFYFFDLIQVLSDRKKATFIPITVAVLLFSIMTYLNTYMSFDFMYYFVIYALSKLTQIIISYSISVNDR